MSNDRMTEPPRNAARWLVGVPLILAGAWLVWAGMEAPDLMQALVYLLPGWTFIGTGCVVIVVAGGREAKPGDMPFNLADPEDMRRYVGGTPPSHPVTPRPPPPPRTAVPTSDFEAKVEDTSRPSRVSGGYQPKAGSGRSQPMPLYVPRMRSSVVPPAPVATGPDFTTGLILGSMLGGKPAAAAPEAPAPGCPPPARDFSTGGTMESGPSYTPPDPGPSCSPSPSYSAPDAGGSVGGGGDSF